MSELLDLIKQRRSIRKYQPRPVSLEAIQGLLEAAQFAPSAHNAQPWRFIVLLSDSAKQKLTQAMIEAWLKDLKRDGAPAQQRSALTKTYTERFTQAPAVIIACLTLQNMMQYPDEQRQKNERDMAVQSLAAAIQNLLLAAHAQGLATCWYCAPLFCKNVVRETLQIPADVEPQALITVGYPDETRQAPKRNSLSGCAYLDSWDSPLRG
jgi:coenzyme F420-0:L-glutamate ligase/coenzyme F420-1:gamma-L-glutamate ligase